MRNLKEFKLAEPGGSHPQELKQLVEEQSEPLSSVYKLVDGKQSPEGLEESNIIPILKEGGGVPREAETGDPDSVPGNLLAQI